MNWKRIYLFIFGVLFVAVFFYLPAYNTWLNTKILGDKLDYQMSHLNLDERKVSRWGYPYMVYLKMLKTITDPRNGSSPASAVIIMPPNEYLRKLHVKNFTTPEPASFYYYVGLQSVQGNSPNAETANWELTVKSDDQIMLRKIPSKQHLDSLITFYRKFWEP